ncbi:RIP metalloprotease RseP [Ruoffia tabacinasalis]|uniref:RIP metalloprotease RseP n=1 Tax=Ruoffia tabacinasalis TaxID=87458 RepID=UPI0030CDB02D
MRYESASVWNKMITNFAGPMNNFILSIIAFTIVAFMIGIPNTDSVIGEVVDGSVAQEAGLVDGDRVTEVDGQSVSEWSDLVLLIQERPNEALAVSVERDNETFDTTVDVQAVTDEQSGEQIGQIDIIADREFSFASSITYGFTATWGVITGVLGVIGSMITSGFNINNFGGPVMMAQATNQVVSLGLPVIIDFLARLSANIGVFNLLPIPALDGGKIVLNAIEAVRGKPLSESKEGIITIIGVLIMVVLMVAVTWNDINRAFFQ